MPSIKGVRSKEGLSSANKGKGVLQNCTFWCKTIGLFEIYGVSVPIRGVAPVRDFCGRPLWTDPN